MCRHILSGHALREIILCRHLRVRSFFRRNLFGFCGRSFFELNSCRSFLRHLGHGCRSLFSRQNLFGLACLIKLLLSHTVFTFLVSLDVDSVEIFLEIKKHSHQLFIAFTCGEFRCFSCRFRHAGLEFLTQQSNAGISPLRYVENLVCLGEFALIYLDFHRDISASILFEQICRVIGVTAPNIAVHVYVVTIVKFFDCVIILLRYNADRRFLVDNAILTIVHSVLHNNTVVSAKIRFSIRIKNNICQNRNILN